MKFNKFGASGGPSKGLGYTVEKFTTMTGIKKLVKSFVGDDCGCDERKEKLNNMFPYELSQSIEKESQHGEPYLDCHDELDVPIAIFNKTDEPDLWSRKDAIMNMGTAGSDPNSAIARFGPTNPGGGGGTGYGPPNNPPPAGCSSFGGCLSTYCCQNNYGPSAYWIPYPICTCTWPPPPPPPPPTGQTATVLPAQGYSAESMSFTMINNEMGLGTPDQLSLQLLEYDMWNYGFSTPNMSSGSTDPCAMSEFFEADW